MFDFFKKPNISTPLFITASLATFILLGIFFTVFSQNLESLVNKNENDVIYVKKQKNTDPMITKNPDLKDILAAPTITSADPTLGPADARITIVQYSDITCKYCKYQEKIFKAIMEKFPEDVRLVWKDFPENKKTSISYRTALASRCAGEQNKFWDFHDLALEKNTLTEQNLSEMAKGLKLDQKLFEDCMQNGQAETFIVSNIEEANALQISGIPFIFINNKEIMGQMDFAELSGMIGKELNK